MQALRLNDILRKYEGMWVALNHKRTEVLASGPSIESVLSFIKNKATLQKPIITFVSGFDTDYVG